jgi:hypothetical protein
VGTALGFGFFPREESSRSSSLVGAFRLDPAFRDDELVEPSASAVSVDVEDRFREDSPGLGRRDPAEPWADDRDRTEDAGEVLGTAFLSSRP